MAVPASEPGVEIRDLRKSYNGTPALSIDELDVRASTTLALIGPSGCGKSTLLRLVIGLLAPDQGSIRIGGVDLTPATRRALQLRTGYVIQEGGLFPHLTGAENVALVARDQGWTRERIERRTRELLDLTQLSPDLLPRYPGELSGGQRQRVALMRALMLDPEMLLLDEPLAALDPMVRSDLQRELKSVFERLRKTVLFVTHDMGEAGYLADEIAILRAGRIVQRGAPRELLRSPADPFVAAFIRAQRPLGAMAEELDRC